MRGGVAPWILGIPVGMIMGLACGEPEVYHCDANEDCNDGYCEVTGFCSFDDTDCPSGRRYGALAGNDLSRACVDPSDIAGGESSSDGGSTSDTGSLTTSLDAGKPPERQTEGGAGDTGSVACGELDESCCAGNVCYDGFCEEGTCQPCRISVAAGNDTTCAWRNDGVLACWGSDASGQLGDGDAIASPGDVVMLDLRVEDVAVGEDHVCAVELDGTVQCWGNNDHGQLGNAEQGETVLEPMPTFPIPPVVQVDAGREHTCVASKTTMHCWGGNVYGQADPQVMANAILLPTDLSVVVARVSTGGYHTCVVGNTMQAACWGRNDAKQSENSDLLSVPQSLVPEFDDLVDIATGDRHTCVVTGGGSVFCWGRNTEGQIGVDTGGLEIGLPQYVEEVADPVQVVAGDFFTCARVESGDVMCWGDNDSGQLGQSDAGGPLPALAEIADVTDLAAGGNHTCAVVDDTEVHCWGSNSAGQLGTDGTPGSQVDFGCG